MPRTTLKDVGARVGVSAKTVSNVVNGTGWVTDEVADRVRAAMAELGYRPNLAARQLRSGRSGMIALALPQLAQPYFAELASQLVRAAHERGITVLIQQTDSDVEAERRILSGIGAPAVDGLIMSPLTLGPADLYARTDPTPLLLLGEQAGASPYPHVAVDNTAAGQAATEHLLGLGRRRVAALGAMESEPRRAADLRLTGYRRGLEAAGLELDERLVLPVVDYQRADGAAAARQLLESDVRPDAIFAFSDLLALGAMHELLVAGVRVPEDIAVIGFDDIEESRYSTPSLSSVSPDTSSLARTAVELLLADPPVPGNHTVDFTIVERASTRRAET
ncbi:DNA-binding transcriptional regulator, LacI/PurR family [Microlunatus sagamiharensis]|uniref:DNA-binding transcriptional regulator, LacI/PurR family n=1 Tax=Microlunatus sagamiharensis TaxID=546874 RepID=A0A1H2MNV5_9ACTN|nr:LacI family DNA-binding transcriptional regulator [Microlunatus sagamiharensis]SDU94166.1 DNA-binding transcriptional regulator, LacI/PurR family [Microlunatus sagamiharensis]